jgi:hypothetical protein
MAINARKGHAHSLAQTDFIGTLYANEGVDAGHLVYKTTSGAIRKVAKLDNSTRSSAGNLLADTALIGFAVTTQAEGDAIESGKIGVYALDGGSVIETSYFTGSVTASDVGKPVVQDGNSGSDGNVTVVASGTTERIIGYVFDAPRNIFVGQTAVSVLPIKLKS